MGDTMSRRTGDTNFSDATDKNQRTAFVHQVFWLFVTFENFKSNKFVLNVK